jgi:hypothetical protein
VFDPDAALQYVLYSDDFAFMTMMLVEDGDALEIQLGNQKGGYTIAYHYCGSNCDTAAEEISTKFAIPDGLRGHPTDRVL